MKPHFPLALLSASIASTLFTLTAFAQSGPVFEEVIVTAEKTVRESAGPVTGCYGIDGC